MKLDRAYQRQILEDLAAIYPDRADWRVQMSTLLEEQIHRYAANITYLAEHGLVDIGKRYQTGEYADALIPVITARGMDFLADDGGLSAILGVVTVKLHEDTLKELIGQRIADSDLPAAEKGKLLDQLKSLPGEAIKHLALKLVDAGLANWPIALQAIEHFVHAPK